ncbi:MAG: hypothetical protein KatS3mg018_0149 [Fimbriimonadales bacterium]|nr:MAG: hypothetical protein KatS3mg018_0149 [Fimbriimonadales bacterium]
MASGRFDWVFRWDGASEGVADVRKVVGMEPIPENAYVEARNDGHLYMGNRRIRFWGVNFTAGANFLRKPDAPKVAERIARVGFNCVRWHHMDAFWANPSLIDLNRPDSRQFNPEALDCMDFLFAELKKRGVYSNFNLLVHRRFKSGDGLPAEIDRIEDVKAQHVVGTYFRPMIELQKEYARQLLTHRNPYTGRPYAEDPALAMVEINNENGLLQGWMLGTIDGLPAVFQADLQRQWNEWLQRRYVRTERLRERWREQSEPLGRELLRNRRFEQGLAEWTLERHSTAQADATPQPDGAVRLRITRAGSAGWHVQFWQVGFPVERGQIYTVRFRARADQPRTLMVMMGMAQDPWAPVGLARTIRLTPEWQVFEFTFGVNTSTNARIGFTEMGTQTGEFWFADLSLRRGGTLFALPEGDPLAQKSLPIIKRSEWGTYPPEVQADWIRFLWETERAYWLELYHYIKRDLRFRGVVFGTIVACSTPHLMATMDVVDTHAYWQHPEFPGGGWSTTDWYVRNIPMVNGTNDMTVTRVAPKRVLGKPFACTEFDNPAPNEYCAEAGLLHAVYAALQDWDALFWYTYSHARDSLDAQRITGFFDIYQHPAKWAFLPACSALFLRQDVRPARQLVVAPFTEDQEMALLPTAGAWVMVDGSNVGLTGMLGWLHRIAIATDPRAMPSGALRHDQVKLPSDRRFVSDTGEVLLDQSQPERAFLLVRTPRSKAAVGFIGGRALDLGDGYRLRVEDAPLGGFAVFSLTVHTDSPERRALVCLMSSAENAGWRMTREAGNRVTLRDQWGQPPSQVVVPDAFTKESSRGCGR